MPPFPIPIHINAPPPDVAIEFALCFDAFAARLDVSGLDQPALEKMIASALQSGFKMARNSLMGNSLTAAIADLIPVSPPGVSVAFLCSQIEHEVAGVWLTPLSFIVKTDNALNALEVLPADQVFAVQFPPATLQKFIDAVWQLIENNNRRLDDDGNPDPTGALEIKERPSLSSPTPSTLQLLIKGTYHWSDLHLHVPFDFTLTSTETLRLTPVGGGLQMVTSTTSQTIDLDQATVDEVQAGIAFIGLFGGFFAVPLNGFLQDYILDSIAGAKNQIPTLLTLGASLGAIIPVQFSIPGSPDKLLLPFDTVTCDLSEGGSGITISGGTMPSLAPRKPSLYVTGPVKILINRYIDQTQVINQCYSLVLADFSTIVSYSWKEAGTLVSSQAMFNAVFDIGDLRVGQSRTYNYVASATDDAGLSASRAFSVTVIVTNYKPPDPPKSGGIQKERPS
jgi:hypothetical protein